MKKITIFLIVGLAVIISGCLNEGTKQNNSENNQNIMLNESENSTMNNSIFIEPMEKEIKFTETVNTLKELKPTAEPYQFKVGETYVYHIRPFFIWTDSQCEQVEIDILVYVESERIINTSKYWILRSEQVNVTPRCRIPLPNGKFRMGYFMENPDGTPIPIPFGGSILAVNKNNLSDVFGLNNDVLNSMCEETQVEVPPEWALYLSENAKIVQKSKGDLYGKECESEMEITVLGSEKIKNKDCFKVEKLSSTNCGYSSISGKIFQPTFYGKEMFWIDKQTRMVMKYQRYSIDNEGYILPEIETELKEIKKSM